MTAQELIDMFRPYAAGSEMMMLDGTDPIKTQNAIRCGIVYVEGLIKLHKWGELRNNVVGRERWEKKMKKLTKLRDQLKAML